eukprot:365136-Chlamydomonas_euryale.AAC.3
MSRQRTAERARNRTGCAAAWRASDLAVTARRTAIALRLVGWGWCGGVWLVSPPPAPAPAPIACAGTRSSHDFAHVLPPMGGRVA